MSHASEIVTSHLYIFMGSVEITDKAHTVRQVRFSKTLSSLPLWEKS